MASFPIRFQAAMASLDALPDRQLRARRPRSLSTSPRMSCSTSSSSGCQTFNFGECPGERELMSYSSPEPGAAPMTGVSAAT